MSNAPLAGVTVLDLGVVIAGAYAGSILASLGADVIKIEAPHGDPFRAYGTAFAHYNRGKRSVVLDLKRPADLAALLQMVRYADVVLDNFRLGVRERLGPEYPPPPRRELAGMRFHGELAALGARVGVDDLQMAEFVEEDVVEH